MNGELIVRSHLNCISLRLCSNILQVLKIDSNQKYSVPCRHRRRLIVVIMKQIVEKKKRNEIAGAHNFRFDGIERWSEVIRVDRPRGENENDECKNKTNIRCTICQLYHCSTSQRNCFKDFHYQEKINFGFFVLIPRFLLLMHVMPLEKKSFIKTCQPSLLV